MRLRLSLPILSMGGKMRRRQTRARGSQGWWFRGLLVTGCLFTREAQWVAGCHKPHWCEVASFNRMREIECELGGSRTQNHDTDFCGTPKEAIRRSRTSLEVQWLRICLNDNAEDAHSSICASVSGELDELQPSWSLLIYCFLQKNTLPCST